MSGAPGYKKQTLQYFLPVLTTGWMLLPGKVHAGPVEDLNKQLAWTQGTTSYNSRGTIWKGKTTAASATWLTASSRAGGRILSTRRQKCLYEVSGWPHRLPRPAQPNTHKNNNADMSRGSGPERRAARVRPARPTATAAAPSFRKYRTSTAPAPPTYQLSLWVPPRSRQGGGGGRRRYYWVVRRLPATSQWL